MSFNNKNIDYSQTVLLKNKILKPILLNYNLFLQKKEKDFSFEENQFIIPNNNKKYYCLIIHKSQLEDTKENFNILYFFNEPSNDNDVHDFFIETNYLFSENILLEGYLYNYPNNSMFLTTDILFKNNEIVDVDYKFRYTLLNELFYPINLSLRNINNNITISIHAIFNNDNKNMINIFKNNFIFKNEICCIETINSFNKKRFLDDLNTEISNQSKIIEKTTYTDVYDVYNDQTKEKEGILYVKGIKESKEIKLLFKNITGNRIVLMCQYNKKFNKWQPV